MAVIPYECGAYYIFDRGYMDFARLYALSRHSAYYVIRAKRNLKIEILENFGTNDSPEILSDQLVRLDGFYSYLDYPENFRRVRYYDKETQRLFTYLTNNMKITADQVALLYKNRRYYKCLEYHCLIKHPLSSFLTMLKITISKNFFITNNCP